MVLWEYAVEILRESIFAYAQACHGSLGTGILAVTFLARLALLPVGLRIARSMARQQHAMTRLQPSLDALRKAHAHDPAKLAEETRRLFAREGVSPVSTTGCVGSLAQMPILVALYSAVRQVSASGGSFLWIRNIAMPDWPLAIAATAFTLVGMTPAAPGASGSASARVLMLSLSAALTIAVLSKMSAGVGLYWGLSSIFSAAQSWTTRSRPLKTAA